MPTEIPIHWIQLGAAVGPHTLNIARDPDASGIGDCLSDFQARLEDVSVPMVLGGSEYSGDMALAYAIKGPEMIFYEANVAPYAATVLTGGMWSPLRESPPGCLPLTECSGTSIGGGNPIRVTDDPQCRTQGEQISDYIEEIIGGNPFVIVEVSDSVEPG